MTRVIVDPSKVVFDEPAPKRVVVDPSKVVLEPEPTPAPSFWSKAGETLFDAAQGAGKGLTFGFADEIAGGLGALADAASSGSFDDLGKNYRTHRDDAREIDDAAKKRSKYAHGIGEVAGAVLAPVPAGAAAQGASLLGRVGRSAAQGATMGAAFGLGNSEADITKGQVGDAAVDAALGGTVGGALGAASGTAGAGVRWVGDKLAARGARGVQKAVQDAEAIAKTAQEKAEASAKGQLGAATQSASRDLEVLAREAAEGLPSSPAARELLESEAGQALRQKVLSSKLESAPQRVSDVDAKRAAYRELLENATQNVEAGKARQLDVGRTIKEDVLPRAWTLGHRALPIALPTLGGYFGGPEWAAAGGLAGGALSLTQGHPGRIVKNLVEKPGFRKAAWDTVEGIGERFSRLGEKTAENAPKALAPTNQTVSELSPAYRALLAEFKQPDDEAGNPTLTAHQIELLRKYLDGQRLAEKP